MEKVYENIKKLRLERGMSQDELAKKTGYTDRSSIAKIEGGGVDLTSSKITEFARVLGVTPVALMGWDDSSPEDEGFGKRVRQRREELGMSQAELANKLGYQSRASVNKIELGKRNMNQSQIVSLAKVLETTPGYLTGWDEENENQAADRYDARIRETFMRNLNKHMRQSDRTQADLARQLHVSTATTAKWCTGQTMPRIDKIQTIADWLGVKWEDLLEQDSSDTQCRDLVNAIYKLNPEDIEIVQKLVERLARDNG